MCGVTFEAVPNTVPLFAQSQLSGSPCAPTPITDTLFNVSPRKGIDLLPALINPALISHR
eukprot:m.269595 g.269595  ORF g.269595 m.269595 type:complete len:60 (+) comp85304_c0_seq1:77-256(+)